MVIIHSRKEDDYKINVDYTPLLKEWCIPLMKYLHSDRQADLMSLIYKLYLPSNLNWKYIENKKDIFKPFQLTSPKETRVVMINFNPVFNKNSNGLAFANKTSFIESKHDEQLIDLFNDIENYQDDGFKIDKDYTLEQWTKQGVLLLNYPLINCSELAKIKFYYLIKAVVEYLNQQTGIIFCLIGDNNNYLKNSINEYTNIVIESKTLSYSVLESINNHIVKSNGKDFKIQW